MLIFRLPVETPEKLAAHLRGLSKEAELRLVELLPPETVNNNGRAGMPQANLPPTITSCHGGGEKEKEVLYWERRSAVLKKMVLGFQQASKFHYHLPSITYKTKTKKSC